MAVPKKKGITVFIPEELFKRTQKYCDGGFLGFSNVVAEALEHYIVHKTPVESVIEYLGEHGPSTRESIRLALNLSSSTMSMVFAALSRLGKLSIKCDGRAGSTWSIL
jgi:DNA-binding MarR family transcriptional regulator